MNDFHAATKCDQELNEKETEYGHIERMAWIAAKCQKDEAKFEMKRAQLENERLQLQLQLQSAEASQGSMPPTSHLPIPGYTTTNGLRLDLGTYDLSNSGPEFFGTP